MNSYLEITRPGAWALVALFTLIGALTAGDASGSSVYVAAVSMSLTAAGGLVLNDYLDRKRDNINKKHRPIPSGRISHSNAIYYSIFLMTLGFIASMAVSPAAIVISLVSTAFIVLYSTHFRYYHIFGNFIFSYLMASAFLMGGAGAGNLVPVIPMAMFFLLANTAREILNDIATMRSDKAFGISTVPVIYGAAYARIVATVFTIAAISILPLTYYYGIFRNVFMSIGAGSIVIFAYALYQNAKERDTEYVGYEMSWGIIVGLAAYLVGALV